MPSCPFTQGKSMQCLYESINRIFQLGLLCPLPPTSLLVHFARNSLLKTTELITAN